MVDVEKGEVLLFQGAEATVYKSNLLGHPCVVKERFRKRYRHSTLDQEITSSRLIAEARAMCRSRRGGIDCPAVYFIDTVSNKMYMELIEGVTLKEFFDCLDTKRKRTEKEETELETAKNSIVRSFEHRKEELIPLIAKAVGESIAKIHNVGLIHGDITTSNIMLRKKTAQQQTEAANVIQQTDSQSGRLLSEETLLTPTGDSKIEDEIMEFPFSVALIDFGLSSTSTMAEDRAVDLYVMERALNSSHPRMGTFMEDLLQEGYLKTVSKSEAVAKKLEEVRQRGRKRLMIG